MKQLGTKELWTYVAKEPHSIEPENVEQWNNYPWTRKH